MLDGKELEAFIDLLNTLKYVSGFFVFCYPIYLRFTAGKRAAKKTNQESDYTKLYNKRLAASQDDKNAAVQKASFYANENKMLHSQVNDLRQQVKKLQEFKDKKTNDSDDPDYKSG